MLKRLELEGTSATVSRIVKFANSVVVVLSPLLLIAWAIDPARQWLERVGIFNESTLVALLGLMISMTLANFHHLLKRTERVDQALADLAKSRSGVIGEGVSNVYPELMRELNGLAAFPKHYRSVDVLGLTLFTAWSQLQGFVQKPEVRDWRLRLHCISPDFVDSGVPGIPVEWAEEARFQLKTIERYLADRGAELALRGIEIELTRYHAFPAVHGFKLGNGALFISFTNWEATSGVLAKPYHPYEKIDATDHSQRAEIYREIFRNWFDHAGATAHSAPVMPKDAAA